MVVSDRVSDTLLCLYNRSFTYDLSGNLLTDSEKGITHTDYGRAAYPFALNVTNPLTSEQFQHSYLYDADDLRIFKGTVLGSSANNRMEYYLKDIAVYDMTTNTWTYYVSTNERIAKVTPLEDQVPGDNVSNTNVTLKLTQLSFYETDHLGNTRIVFSPEKFNADGSILRKIHFAADYYPYGKTLRYFETSTFEEKYLTTHHERDRETGFDYRGARFYDSDLGRFLSLDPLAHMRSWVSPYNFVQNNPILRIDPNGRLDGEYDVVKNDDGTTTKTKISDLGDEDGIDFFHHLNGDQKGNTEIVNNNTGEINWVRKGVKYIRGYTQRDDNTNWNSIYQEWQSGTGPENSLFYGRDNPMIKDIRTSNLYHGARDEYLKLKAWDFDNKISKKYIPIDFGLSGLLLSGTNMTMQMMGSGGASFYDIGNHQRLTIITDQKTKESFYYHLPWINNVSRTGSGTQPKQSTTNQTYIWIDNNVEE